MKSVSDLVGKPWWKGGFRKELQVRTEYTYAYKDLQHVPLTGIIVPVNGKCSELLICTILEQELQAPPLSQTASGFDDCHL